MGREGRGWFVLGGYSVEGTAAMGVVRGTRGGERKGERRDGGRPAWRLSRVAESQFEPPSTKSQDKHYTRDLPSHPATPSQRSPTPPARHSPCKSCMASKGLVVIGLTLNALLWSASRYATPESIQFTQPSLQYEGDLHSAFLARRWENSTSTQSDKPWTHVSLSEKTVS